MPTRRGYNPGYGRRAAGITQGMAGVGYRRPKKKKAAKQAKAKQRQQRGAQQQQQPTYYAPQPTYYAPQPTYYAPQPTYYAPQPQQTYYNPGSSQADEVASLHQLGIGVKDDCETAAVWYVSNNGQQLGPFNPMQIEEMAERDEITEATLFYKSGLSGWLTLDGLDDAGHSDLPDYLIGSDDEGD